MTGPKPNEADDLTDKRHLYKGLGNTPSAHLDPPASAISPDGGRVEAAPVSETPGVLSPAYVEPAGSVIVPVEYARSASRSRGRGTKLAFAVVAIVAGALAYLYLPHFGFGPGAGKGGTGPGNGGASPAPPSALESTPTQPNASTPATLPNAAATATGGQLHLTIQKESYLLGSTNGKEVTLEEALGLASRARPDSPVIIDLNDSSRALAEENLKAAFEKKQIPLLWMKDGKPITGDLPGTGVPANR